MRELKNFILIGLILTGVCFFPSVMALTVLFLPLGILKKPYQLGLILSVLVLILLIPVTPLELYKYNQIIRQSLWLGNWQILRTPFLWLYCTAPALMFSIILVKLKQLHNTHQRELRHLARGKHATKRHLSEIQISKKLKNITSAVREDGAILGIDVTTGERVHLTDAQANSHTLALGTTGSGKTTTICNIIESAIIRKLPVFYVDGKGDLELAHRMQAFVNKQQRPFYLFSMVGDSVHYNPLASGGITSKKDRIIELRHWSEDHYRKIAEGYLQTVFAILSACEIKVDLIQLTKYLKPGALYGLVRDKRDQSLIEKIEQLEGKENQITSLIAEIENIANSEIGHLFDCRQSPYLTLQKALDEQACVYFCLQPLAFPAYANSLGKLIINDLKALAASQLALTRKTKIYTLFDEFSVFAGDQVINLINQGRSAGIHAVLSTQSLSDLTKNGGDAFLGQVISNCNNFIIQRQNHHHDAELLANIIGTRDSFELTSQLSEHTGSTGLGSVRKTRGYLVHPDEIKQLQKGEGFLLNKSINTASKLCFRHALC